MGSKNRIAKEILPIILKDRKPDQWYVEPFVGGANMIDKVDCLRIGNDVNKYLIALLKHLQENIPFDPPRISEDEYKKIQHHKSNYPDWLVGYVGFCLSFSGKFMGGYARDKSGDRSFENEAQQNLKAQQNNLIGIDFCCGSYFYMEIPPNSIIYCDPPYVGTVDYHNKFYSSKFWEWARRKAKEGHGVFVSEYIAPKDFRCVWAKELLSTVSQRDYKTNIEKLFVPDF